MHPFFIVLSDKILINCNILGPSFVPSTGIPPPKPAPPSFPNSPVGVSPVKSQPSPVVGIPSVPVSGIPPVPVSGIPPAHPVQPITSTPSLGMQNFFHLT